MERCLYRINSEWNVQENDEEKKTFTLESVIISQIEDEEENGENSMQPLPTYGIHLVPKDETKACSITVETGLNQPLRISAIDVLSSAKHCEVFGAMKEYVCTCDGMWLEVDSQENLYLKQHTFDESVNKCTIKFVSLTEKNRLWLQSIHITLQRTQIKTSGFPGLTPSIDLDKVKAMMADMGTEVPSSQKTLLKSMEHFQKNQQMAAGGLQQMGAMAGLMGMFSSIGGQQTKPKPLPQNNTNLQEDSTKNNEQSIVSDKTEVKKINTTDQDVRKTASSTGADSCLSVKYDKLNNVASNQNEGSEAGSICAYLEGMETRLKEHISQEVTAAETRIMSRLETMVSAFLLKRTTQIDLD